MHLQKFFGGGGWGGVIKILSGNKLVSVWFYDVVADANIPYEFSMGLIRQILRSQMLQPKAIYP